MKSTANELLRQSDHVRVQLCKAGLLALSALNTETKFPDDTTDLEALVDRIVKGHPRVPINFAIEASDEPSRHTGKDLIWISPAIHGCLRLRQEWDHIRSIAVVLRPDGRLGEFEPIIDLSVAESESTETARANISVIGHHAEESEGVNAQKIIEEARCRFCAENILSVHAAAPQVRKGPIVSFAALYSTGVTIDYLVPSLPDEELGNDDPWSYLSAEAMEPQLTVSDSLGTNYEEVALDALDPMGALMRVSHSFIPAVPKEAKALSVRFDSGSVEIPLTPR